MAAFPAAAFPAATAAHPRRWRPGGGNFRAATSGRDDVEFLPRTPIYIPATLTFDGITFTNIGLRLKGNSSLLNSWRSGAEKLPFRLNADGLEDQLPEARDQTFFGFPNLNLTNNSQDASFLRAKVVGDLFREAGVPAARTAFVRVFFDRGEGAQYLGLYTLVEIPDEPMLAAQFGSEDGNLYKPNGTGARWTVFLAESFPKKTNQQRRGLDRRPGRDRRPQRGPRRIPPSGGRGSKPDSRVSSFLRWLALNTIIGNTDTYGGFSPHNYWVYGSPRHRDRLFFIPWDHDLALNAAGPGGGGGGGRRWRWRRPDAGLDLFHDRINASWPLIRYLMDDPVYRAAYRGYLEEMLNTVFEPTALTARLQAEVRAHRAVRRRRRGRTGRPDVPRVANRIHAGGEQPAHLRADARGCRAAGAGDLAMTVAAVAPHGSARSASPCPAAAQARQPRTQAKPPPPVFEVTPEAYIQLDWRGYPDFPCRAGQRPSRVRHVRGPPPARRRGRPVARRRVRGHARSRRISTARW